MCGDLIAVSKVLMVEYSDVALSPFSTAAVLFTEVPNKIKRHNRKNFLLSFPECKEKAFHNEDRDWNWRPRESKESPLLKSLKTQLHTALGKLTLY